MSSRHAARSPTSVFKPLAPSVQRARHLVRLEIQGAVLARAACVLVVAVVAEERAGGAIFFVNSAFETGCGVRCAGVAVVWQLCGSLTRDRTCSVARPHEAYELPGRQDLVSNAHSCIHAQDEYLPLPCLSPDQIRYGAERHGCVSGCVLIRCIVAGRADTISNICSLFQQLVTELRKTFTHLSHAVLKVLWRLNVPHEPSASRPYGVQGVHGSRCICRPLLRSIPASHHHEATTI
jgi:hypothetical protein